jgi:6,7-dimethyl-8-ribityllumazine synthase
MSSLNKSLSVFEGTEIPSGKGYKVGIVWAEWNHTVTHALMQGAMDLLLKQGVQEDEIFIHTVPGSFELTLGAQYLAEFTAADAIITLGCVIQGETRHFDFICESVAKGITNLNIKYNKPFIFGVLTPDTQQQAEDRAGGKHGNKGEEAAVTALKMLVLRDKLKHKNNPVGFGVK